MQAKKQLFERIEIEYDNAEDSDERGEALTLMQSEGYRVRRMGPVMGKKGLKGRGLIVAEKAIGDPVEIKEV